MGAKAMAERASQELGVSDLAGGFRALHSPQGGSYPGLPLPLDILGMLVSQLEGRRRRGSRWTGLPSVPRGRVTVGITAEEVLVGRRGKVLARFDRDGAFGDAEGPLGDAWIEIAGVRLGVQGADADEALRLRRLCQRS